MTPITSFVFRGCGTLFKHMEANRIDTTSKPKRRYPNNNKSNNARKNENSTKNVKKSSDSEIDETLALVNIIRENGVSTKHVVDGLPPSVMFVSTCEICYEEREFFGMFSCNHCVCMQCLLKQTLFTESISCCHCRNIYDSIIFFRVNQELPNQYPPIDIERCKKRYVSRYNSRLQRKYNIIFGCSLTVQAFDHILGHRCYICDRNDDDSDHKTFQKLKEHYLKKHGRKFCDICCEHEKKFSSERIPFTFSEYKDHQQGKKTLWEELATDGHVNCRFCRNKIFYGSEERFRHYRLEHQTCEICLREKNEFMVFENFKCLLFHYEKNHYLCSDNECRKSGLCFSTDAELQIHVSEYHKKTNRTQPVPLSFPSSLRGPRVPINNPQPNERQDEERTVKSNTIQNAVVKTSSNNQGIGMYNYASTRANLGIRDNNAFPSLVSTVNKPQVSSNLPTASSIIVSNKPPPPDSSKKKTSYEATSSDFPSLINSSVKKTDNNVWGAGNSQKLKKVLTKPVVSVTTNTKEKVNVPKPRDFDPNTWANSSSSSQDKKVEKNAIPRISGFADFQDVVTDSKSSSLNNIPPSNNGTTNCSKNESENEELFVRADGFKIPTNTKRPPLAKTSEPTKKVPPIEAFPILANPYQPKKDEKKVENLGNETSNKSKKNEPKDFNSVVDEMFKNLSKNKIEQ
uniref:B9 domain-containing protein 1 n=1 Tax=Strongyloides stercoralis TaxID=6248 RepID=A0A0K0EQK6_STRER